MVSKLNLTITRAGGIEIQYRLFGFNVNAGMKRFTGILILVIFDNPMFSH